MVCNFFCKKPSYLIKLPYFIVSFTTYLLVHYNIFVIYEQYTSDRGKKFDPHQVYTKFDIYNSAGQLMRFWLTTEDWLHE